MPSPSRHGLPRLPRQRPAWKRIGTWILAKVGYAALLAVGVAAALAVASGTNGTSRMVLAVGTVYVVVYGGLRALPIAGLIGNMIITRWRWHRG